MNDKGPSHLPLGVTSSALSSVVFPSDLSEGPGLTLTPLGQMGRTLPVLQTLLPHITQQDTGSWAATVSLVTGG